jgi:hypothetical protein
VDRSSITEERTPPELILRSTTRRVPPPKTSSTIDTPDRSSRLGTLPNAKLKGRYAQMVASSRVSVRNPLAKIPSTRTPTVGVATSRNVRGVSNAVTNR